LEFPEIFYEGARPRQNPGFDVVVGNPPWGAALEDDEKKYISANYPVTARNFDTYVGMIERDLGVMRAGGILGYITPDAWLTGVSYVPLRKLLLASGLLLDFVNLPYDIFQDAYVDTVTMVFRKNDISTNARTGKVGVINFNKKESISDINSHLSRRTYVDYSVWERDPYLAFRVSLSPADYSIESKLAEKTIALGSITKIDRGLEAYSKFRQSDEEIAKRIYHAPKKLDNSYIKQFKGELRRYSLIEGEELWVKWGPHLAEHPDLTYFERPRVLLRRLISRQFRLMAAYANTAFANDSSTFNIISNDPSYDLFFILALLNSKLLSHFQIRRSQLAQRDDFPKLSLEEARRFPIRRIEFITAETDRKHLVEKSKSLYERCLLKNDLLCVTGFVDHCLKQDPQES